MTTDQNPDFDGCNSECRKAGKHSLRWGGCEQATPPEPTVSMSVVYMDTDGGPSIGFDTYTVPELARLIEPALSDPLKAAAAARRIVHRHDEQQPAVPSVAVPPTQAALRDRIRRAVCEAEGFGWDTDMLEPDEYGEVADMVLAVLPAPVDRAAVLREAADVAREEAHRLETGNHDARAARGARSVAYLLRRLAEAPQPCPGYETVPNRCRCDCEGCKHNCAAHQPAEAPQPETETGPDPLAEARATNRRLNHRAQQLEAELAAYRRAVRQWEVSERGTYIPHSSLRAIGKACGVDALGTVRHLKHFERVEQAEAAIERVRRLHDALDAETTLTSPDGEITRGAAARKIAAALDGWTAPAAPAVVAQPGKEG